MVKKRGIVWNYYNKKVDGSQVIAFCKFCNQSYIQNATRMERHLERCPKTPHDIRHQFMLVTRNKSHKLAIATSILAAANTSSLSNIKKSDPWANAESSANANNVTDTELEDLDEWGYRNQIYSEGTSTAQPSTAEMSVPTETQWIEERDVDESAETNGEGSRTWEENRNGGEGEAEEEVEVQERRIATPLHRGQIHRKISGGNFDRQPSRSPLQHKILQEQLLERRAARRTAELELRRKTLELERSQWEYEREKAHSELRWAHEIRMMQLAEDRERQIIEENRRRVSGTT